MTDVIAYLQPPALAAGWFWVVRSLITSLERVVIAYLNRPQREAEAARTSDKATNNRRQVLRIKRAQNSSACTKPKRPKRK